MRSHRPPAAMNILITLPADRDQLGSIGIPSNGPPEAPFLASAICLGRSDEEFATLNGNPSRDPLHVGGDLPYGEYSCTIEWFKDPDESTLHSYGPYGKIHLTPTGGDAVCSIRSIRISLVALFFRK